MAHPYHHALSSVRKWGGVPEDYLELHAWFDESKQMIADYRHRALRHHAEGIFMLEKIFKPTITLSTPRDPDPLGRRTARARRPRSHSVICRLGARHPTRAVDGPRRTSRRHEQRAPTNGGGRNWRAPSLGALFPPHLVRIHSTRFPAQRPDLARI